MPSATPTPSHKRADSGPVGSESDYIETQEMTGKKKKKTHKLKAANIKSVPLIKISVSGNLFLIVAGARDHFQRFSPPNLCTFSTL